MKPTIATTAPLKLYEFALPRFTNQGIPYDVALREWSKCALSRAGGVTVMPDCDGAWYSDDEARVYLDKMVGHRVACSPEIAEGLLNDARLWFYDQKAFFVSEIGQAFIVPKE